MRQTFFLHKILDFIANCGIGIEVTNAFIAEEENGATWLFEPRITSAQPIKYCGTLHHAVPADNLVRSPSPCITLDSGLYLIISFLRQQRPYMPSFTLSPDAL